MITIPFIYFTFLSFILYRKHKSIDLAVLVSLMFAVSGFISILLDVQDQEKIENIGTYCHDISLLPALSYCFLLTICIIPISKINIDCIKLQPIRNVSLCKILAVVVIVWFLSSTIMARNDLARALIVDNMVDNRADLYAGIEVNTRMSFLPMPIKMIYALLNYIFSSPWVLLFLGFYSLVASHVQLKYSICFLIASLNGPIDGIIGADRSQVAYWIIAFIFIYRLFYWHIPNKIKKNINVFTVILLSALVCYLAAMTFSRFDDRLDSGGVMGSLVAYLGQSYINFCYFFDNYQLPYHHWGIIFPFTSEYIFGVPAGGVLIQTEMSFLSKMFTGVFYTFIGHIMVGLGQFWAVFITLIYALITNISLSKFNYRRTTITIQNVYLGFAMVSVVALGLFGHYYAGVGKLFSVIVCYFLVKKLR